MAVRYHIGVNGYDFRTWSYQDIGAFLQKLEMTCFELQYDMHNEQLLTEASSILADYGVHIPAIYTSSQWSMVNATTAN